MTKNFPNLFQLVGPNTVLGHNSIIFMIESQVNYILQLIRLVEESGQKQLRSSLKFKTLLTNVFKSSCKEPYGKLAAVVVGINLPMVETFHYGQLTHGSIG